jgi:hypothetical protein
MGVGWVDLDLSVAMESEVKVDLSPTDVLAITKSDVGNMQNRKVELLAAGGTSTM